MPINVTTDGGSVAIDSDVFVTLLDNSVAGTYRDYERALESGEITLTKLEYLSRRGDIPYALFFAPAEVVKAQVAIKTEKLLAGVSKDGFSIGSREVVKLRDVELIVKDLIRKQELLKTHDSSLVKNRIVGLLRKKGPSPDADAERLLYALGISSDDISECRTKEKALEFMIEKLETNQVLVSQSVQHYMPQRLSHVTFSGMTIRDSKIPFIFLAGGDHGDFQEPAGRRVFTLALMAVLVARRIFAPVTWDGQSLGTEPGREFDIAGAMLMPSTRMKEFRPQSLDDMKAAAGRFKVTPSAVTVRAMRLGLITSEVAKSHLTDLKAEFEQTPKRPGGGRIRPENAVRKYSGKELTSRMLQAMDSGYISMGDFCRAVCLNKLKPSQIPDLRSAIA